MQVNNNSNVVTQEQMSMYVRNKPKFYEAMGRHGYELPSMNSALCSLEWLQGVREDIFFCPYRWDSEIRRTCYSLPPKSVLLKKLNVSVRAIIA